MQAILMPMNAFIACISAFAFCCDLAQRRDFENQLRAVHQRRTQSGEKRGCSVRTFCRQGEGSLNTDVLTFWYKKFEFFKISKGFGGIEPVRTFFGQEGCQFFAILCERLLWTAP